MYQLFNELRRCPVCCERDGSILFICSGCWEKLLSESNKKKYLMSSNYSVPVRRICIWDEFNSKLVSSFLYNLKYGHSNKVYKKLAILLLSQIRDQSKVKASTCLVPAPGKTGMNNHAKLFANQLSKLLNVPVFDILKEENEKRIFQKKLSKKERTQKKIKLSIPNTESLKGSNIVFIDDVITTGSTALAAYEALNFPYHYEVWVMAEKVLEH